MIQNNDSPGIGTLQEKSLHAALKEWYARPGDQFEVPVDGFVIDLVRQDTLIEIQTGNFGALRSKLRALLPHHPVRLVYPIPRTKWIVRVQADGHTMISRRQSPKHGRLEDLFDELVRIPTLLSDPNLEIEVVFTHQEAIWCDDGQGSWRRKRWSVRDHRLLEVVDQVHLASPDDLRPLLPPALPRPFTNRQLARALGLRRRLAQRMTYCLRKMGVLVVSGKRRNAFLYTDIPQNGEQTP